MSALEPAGVKSWGEMQAEDCVLSIGSKRTCGHGTLGCVNHHAPPLPIEPAGVGVDTPPPSTHVDGDYFADLVAKARVAAEKATRKFPQPNYVTLKIAEEAGEVVRGAVHYAEGRMPWDEVDGEIIQLIAMLIRFVTEGDEINGIRPPTLATTEGKDNG